jgi:hypothetical protein
VWFASCAFIQQSSRWQEVLDTLLSVSTAETKSWGPNFKNYGEMGRILTWFFYNTGRYANGGIENLVPSIKQ